VPDDFDVLIAGGGIAGLSAGLTSARLGRTTLVLTGEVPGGLLLSIETIEGMPGFPGGVPGYELCPLVQEQASEAGAEFQMAVLESIEAEGAGWRVATRDGELWARAVILATGARFKELGLPGEERLRGHGVSHCASCDAPLLRDRAVGVVGGGDSALQEALTLAEAASRVIIVNEGRALTGQASYRSRALAHPRIEVRDGTVVEDILGEETLASVRIRELATGRASELEVGGLFVYVGLRPNTECVTDRLRLDASGRVPTDAALRTELIGVLAAGIVRVEAPGRAASAAGEGAAAAVAADRYLADRSWPEQLLADATAVALGTGGADA
jgi:thioredoxin reductase (NADPH)